MTRIFLNFNFLSWSERFFKNFVLEQSLYRKWLQHEGPANPTAENYNELDVTINGATDY